MPRIPVLADASPLRERFAAALLSSAPLDPSLGPLDIDLLRRIRRYAPSANPLPVSADTTVVAAGDRWRVLWPPDRIEAGDRGIAKIERVVTAYENAAQNSPETRRRLDAVRESEAFRELLSEPPSDSGLESRIEPNLKDDHNGLDFPSDRDHRDDELELQGVYDDDQGLIDVESALDRAARALRNAANDLSLIMVSTESKVLLTGDATQFAMSQAMRRTGRSFNLVVTPHHGGRRHVPSDLRASQSPFWASSAGGSVARHVSSEYDLLGLHHRTDVHGGGTYIVGQSYVEHVLSVG
jgi:hypothetical protein